MVRIRYSDSSQKRRWKYTERAKRRRYCESCSMPLAPSEAYLCMRCYTDLVMNIREVENETLFDSITRHIQRR